MGNYVDINESAERLSTVLDRVGYLSIEQAHKVNFNNILADAAIRKLCQENRAFYSENRKFLLRHPWRKPYMPIIEAVDVMLAFLMNIDIKSIFVKEFIPKNLSPDDMETPSSFNPENDKVLLGFARNTRLYEVYSARNKEELENLYFYLENRHKKFLENNGENEGIRYLILVKTKSLFLYESKDASYLYAFAFIDQGSHEVQFFNPQSNVDLVDVNQEA